MENNDFTDDGNGIITNAVSLLIGEYWLEVRVYDVYDNYCTITILISVEPRLPNVRIPGFNMIILFVLLGVSMLLGKKKIKIKL